MIVKFISYQLKVKSLVIKIFLHWATRSTKHQNKFEYGYGVFENAVREKSSFSPGFLFFISISFSLAVVSNLLKALIKKIACSQQQG